MPAMESHDPYLNHWADQAAAKTLAAHPDAKRITVAAGITPSGVVHVGNFREVMTVDLVARALRDRGAEVRFIYSWDDFDVFRKVPADLPKRELLTTHLGRSIVDVPDPWDQHDSYASHHIAQFERSARAAGHPPEFIRQSAQYRKGTYAVGIQKALQGAAKIREILNRVREQTTAHSRVEDEWLPLSGFCDECGRDKLKPSRPRRVEGPLQLRALRPRARRRPARGRQPQAAVAHRLADALGPRGRVLRAGRQGPQHRGRQLRHGEGHRPRDLRLPRAGVRGLRLRAHQGQRRQDLELEGRRDHGGGLPRGLRARGAALDLRVVPAEHRVPDQLRRRRHRAVRGLRPPAPGRVRARGGQGRGQEAGRPAHAAAGERRSSPRRRRRGDALHPRLSPPQHDLADLRGEHRADGQPLQAWPG
jgi:hypothetical protein